MAFSSKVNTASVAKVANVQLAQSVQALSMYTYLNPYIVAAASGTGAAPAAAPAAAQGRL